jgi:hypothetical protein
MMRTFVRVLALHAQMWSSSSVQSQLAFPRVVRLGLGLLLGSCSLRCTAIEEPTRLIVTLDAPRDLRARTAAVELALAADAQHAAATDAQLHRFTLDDGDAGWPLTWTFRRVDGAKRYAMIGTAKAMDGSALASVSAVGDYREQGTREVHLLFDPSCPIACSGGQTCMDGKCVAPELNAAVVATPDDHDPPATRPTGQRTGDAGAADSGSATMTSCPAGGCTAASCGQSGSCDALTTCSMNGGQVSCSACPSGFTGTGRDGCVAALSDLRVSGATLEPAFDPEQTEYTLSVGLLGDAWTLTPTAAAQATLMLDGRTIASGAPAMTSARPQLSAAVTLRVSATGHNGRDYHFTLQEGGAQIGFIKADPPTAGAHLGHALAIDGDTLVTTAPNEPSEATGIDASGAPNARAKDSGAAYVFVRDGEHWTRQAFIKASDSAVGQQFGTSVALAADTLVIGAMHDSYDAGAVYVYGRSGTTWRERGKLVSPSQQGLAQFGQSVALHGDTLVVGAGAEDQDGNNDIGAAYVFTRGADGNFSFQKRMTAPMPGAYAWYGSCVRLSGSYLLVGATGENSSAGVAYVYRADTLDLITTLRPSVANAVAFFGNGAAIDGDTIAVTAFNGTAGLTNGTVYVFQHTHDAEFVQIAALQASNASGGDAFGISIALAGPNLVVGASHESSGGAGIDGDVSAPGASHSGAAYLFTRAGDAFTETARIKASMPTPDDQFGTDVAISGDMILVTADSDARGTANLEPYNHDAAGGGAIYLFR